MNNNSTLLCTHFAVRGEMSAGVPSAADDRPKAGAVRRLAKTIAETADADGTIPSPVVGQVRPISSCKKHFFIPTRVSSGLVKYRFISQFYMLFDVSMSM